MRLGITPENPMGDNAWEDMCQPETSNLFETIAYCNNGNMWATLKEPSNRAFFRGFDEGSEWVEGSIELAENFLQISCGWRGYAWAVGVSGTTYRLDGVTADTPQGTHW
jgi:hypothetical protein